MYSKLKSRKRVIKSRNGKVKSVKKPINLKCQIRKSTYSQRTIKNEKMEIIKLELVKFILREYLKSLLTKIIDYERIIDYFTIWIIFHKFTYDVRTNKTSSTGNDDVFHNCIILIIFLRKSGLNFIFI